MIDVLGVGIYNPRLMEIAKKANIDAKETPACNVVRIPNGTLREFMASARSMDIPVRLGELTSRIVVG